MSTKKRKAPRIVGAKDRLIAQREAEARAKRERRRTTAITLTVVVVLLIGGAGLYGWYATHKQPVADAVPSTSASTSASASAARAYEAVKVVESTGLKVGYADAPNTVTIYSDFACSHCQEFEAAYGPTLSTLVQAGGISIDYWPLGILTEGSARASNAMACAAERDPSFGVNMYDGIFTNYGLDWSNDQLISLATQLSGTLPDGFETCVTSGAHAAWVKSIYATAKAGPAAKGTPVVLVNGANFDLTTGTVDSLTALLK